MVLRKWFIPLALSAALAFSVSASTTPQAADAVAAKKVSSLPLGTNFDYQLGGAKDRSEKVGILVRDRKARPQKSRYNVCYINGFQSQPDEKKFWLAHKNLLLSKNDKLVEDEAWGEWILDIRTAGKRAELLKIMKPWIKQCGLSGFKAVEFDNFDSFDRSRGLVTRSHNIAFGKDLAKAAHGYGLAAGQKNMAEYDGRKIGFDFAISESCAQYVECKNYVKNYGKQVLMVEYSAKTFSRACKAYGKTHAIVLRDSALKPTYGPKYC